jgi:simple sugar transport system ATP-binding protein
MAESFLRVTGISKSFAGVQALQGVDLSIARGEVHCLAGENGSGKSTLIKIIAGALEPDRGEIEIDGVRHSRLTPMEAIRHGVQIIYQDFSLFPNLTVAENLALNRQLVAKKRFVDWRDIRRTAREALDKIGVEIDLDARLEQLPVADKQLIAISRALVNDARLIIMDEPTTALTQKEVETLLAIIRRLQDEGVSILFVSHKLNEVFAIAERITVLRNGRRVAQGRTSEFDYQRLAREMTGRSLADGAAKPSPFEADRPLLEVTELTKREHFRDVSFELHRGEVLGLTGLLGSGRTALAMALCGLTDFDHGTIRIDGNEVRIGSVGEAIDHGIAYVPEDRLTEGLFLSQSIGDNIVVSQLDRLSSGAGMLDRRAVEDTKREWVQRLRVVTPSHELPVSSLSGGNQQRVVLARWLATQPRILVLNGPTVGVDVGSKGDIHEIVRGLAEEGMGVLVISDDMPELLQLCHRLLIMKAGRISETLPHLDLTEDDLAHRLAS